ncbi:MAG: TetR/AcrR family transcriptional regulator [Acidimicrobiia bacterium]|nr:TetR/AcrR family transcriptional regulator [Acidimicrobiia bacterium]
MTSETRNSIDDVIEAAGRLFARNGYEGTSMRDLGRELGLLGSSLYSHVAGKQDLLVAVVERGGFLFQQSAEAALRHDGSASDQLRALIAGHIGVVLDHRDEVRTFLNEARSLDGPHRKRVLASRDAYEQTFRDVIARGIASGEFADTVDPKTGAIFVLSILNALERWFRDGGSMDRGELATQLWSFVYPAFRPVH